jgi:hypothetical protein
MRCGLRSFVEILTFSLKTGAGLPKSRPVRYRLRGNLGLNDRRAAPYMIPVGKSKFGPSHGDDQCLFRGATPKSIRQPRVVCKVSRRMGMTLMFCFGIIHYSFVL